MYFFFNLLPTIFFNYQLYFCLSNNIHEYTGFMSWYSIFTHTHKYICTCLYTLLYVFAIHTYGLPWQISGKESTCQCRRCGFDPWVGKIPWRRKWEPTPVFSLGKSHEQTILAGYSPWGSQESDTPW